MTMTRADFYSDLYEFCESGTVNVRYLPSKKSFFLPFEKMKTATFTDTENVYFAVASRNGGGRKEHILEIPALWADLDFKVISQKEADNRLKFCPLQPSAIIHSGGGYHCYWFFKEPCAKEDIETVESYLRRLALFLGADMVCAEAAHILRIPGTLNHKYDPPREVKLLLMEPGRRYDLSDFYSWLPEDRKEKTKTGEYRNAQGWQDDALKGVKQGDRHGMALKLAGRWATLGLSDTEILNGIVAWNLANTPSKESLSDPNSKEMQDILAYVRGKNEHNANTSCSIIQPGEFTDLGNAMRFAKEHEGRIRYCHKFGKWLHWRETHWAMDEAGEIWRTAKDYILRMLEKAKSIQDDRERASYLKEMAKIQNAKKQEAMVNMARHMEEIFVRAENLDRDPLLFNCEKGTVDLRDFKYLPHNPENLITKISPFTIADRADCPKWKAHLDLIMAGNQELTGFLQRAFGSCLAGDNRDRKLFLLWGNGANGKSVTLETVHAILGDYVMKTPVETLLVKRFETIPNDLARLNGARFVYTSEVQDGKRLAESLVKELSGDKYIQARFMRGEWFDILVTFKIFLATNHLPNIRGTDPAIWDRIMLIPFNVRIPEEQRRPREELIDKFKTEGPGILRWLLDGCYEWIHNGLNTPPEVLAANSDYQWKMDILKQFIEDKCVTGERKEVLKADLYARYEQWAKDNGEEPISKTAFGKSLQEKGYRSDSRDNQGRRIWKGIGLIREEAS